MSEGPPEQPDVPEPEPVNWAVMIPEQRTGNGEGNSGSY